MKRAISPFLVALLCVLAAYTQESAPSAVSGTARAVPSVISFNGTLSDSDGRPLTAVTGVTFLLYAESQGGAPLWMETQNVHPDESGHYAAVLGSTTRQGLPQDVFASGEARWLAVQIAGQQEQPRLLLVAVPYALKAADAETIGGLPPSAFVLAAPSPGGATASAANTNAAAPSAPSPATSNVTTTGGTVNALPLWTTATNIQTSVVTQSGSGATTKIGINTPTPGTTLDVNGAATVRGTLFSPATGTATATKGFNSQPYDFVASSFNSGTKKAVNQTFQWQAEAAGNNSGSPSGTLNLLFGSGTIPAETGLKLSNKGIFTFAPGQTFPGTGPGTITGVTAGTALTGGGTSGKVTVDLDTTQVPLLAASNTFSGNQTIQNGVLAISTTTPLLGSTIEADVNAPGVIGPVLSLVNVGGGLNAGAAVDFQTYAEVGFPYNPGARIEAVDVGNFGDDIAFLLNNPGAPSNGLAEPFKIAANHLEPGTVATGFSAPSGSNLVGTAAIVANGGSGDPLDPGAIGGDGIDATPGYGVAYAGFFNGNAYVNGNLILTGQIFAGTKDFKIDHPLDPANKYLVHASVESSEMMNIYTGNVITDGQGEATVQLPKWFEALNADFRYQLTVIGVFAQAIIGHEIQNHEFTIRTSAPNVKVSWQVTGVRQDAFAKAHPLVVEEEKDARTRGFYIHPELYGAPAEKQIEWARHSELMKRSRERSAPPRPVVRPAALGHALHTPK